MTQFALDVQDTLENIGKGKIILLGDFYSKPFYCSILPIYTNKNEFYWSGQVLFTVITTPVAPRQPSDVEPVLSTSATSDADTNNQQFGAQVVSGYIKAGLDTSTPTTW